MWSLVGPSWDAWVWRGIESIIISDPTFLLINREKISGKRNCSSHIAVCSLFGFWLVLVCCFFFLVVVAVL